MSIKQTDERYVAHTYKRFDIAIVKGEGCLCYDDSGKEYIDMTSGIGVNAFGYSDPVWAQAVADQAKLLQHTSNLYYTAPCAELAEILCTRTGMEKVFFSNSGAEAIEGALKTARKYAFLKDGTTDHEIIALEHSFHGRTFGALSVTGNAHYREAFEPMIGGVRFAGLNDLDSVKALMNPGTCAVIMETVQGEGGLRPADREFLAGVRTLCDENDALLILDEIQCGMGRTGSMFAWQEYGVKPDVMTTAKALGCGVPVGAFLMTEKVGANSLVAGDHGTTYGGNPLACAAVSKVLDVFEADGIVDHVRTVAPYLEEKLDELASKYDFITERRGKGLMQGLVFDRPVGDVIKAAMSGGLIIINAGTNILRFVPPLVIGREHVDEMIDVLSGAIEETIGA